MLEDVYDLLLTLVQHAGRTGLAEHIVHAAEAVITAADPKILQKKQAAEAAAAQAAKDYAEFEAFKAFQAAQAAAGQPAAGSVPSPQPAAAAPAPVAPPVVTG